MVVHHARRARRQPVPDTQPEITTITPS
jgi:hypothetical protein